MKHLYKYCLLALFGVLCYVMSPSLSAMVKTNMPEAKMEKCGIIKTTYPDISDLIQEKKVPVQASTVQASVAPPTVQVIKNSKFKVQFQCMGIEREEILNVSPRRIIPISYSILNIYPRVNEFYIFSLRKIVI